MLKDAQQQSERHQNLNCFEKEIQIAWIRSTAINMVCSGIIMLNKFAVVCFVMLFFQNISSFIRTIQTSGFKNLSSRTVLGHPEVLVCSSLQYIRQNLLLKVEGRVLLVL